MDNAEKTKKAAELLLEGAAMLQISCPQCTDPIYRKRNGQMFCVNCNSVVMYEKDATKQVPSSHTSHDDDPIQRKIAKLAVMLDKEDDPDKIVELANTIKKLQAMK